MPVKFKTPKQLAEMIRKSYRGLVKQGKAAINPKNGDCLYRYSGLKCAIGHLIPDSEYQKSFEGRSVSDKDVLNAINVDPNDNQALDTLESWQTAHDESRDLSEKDFRNYLRSEANILLGELGQPKIRA